MAGTIIDVENLSDGFFDAQINNNTPDRVYSAMDYASLFDGVVSDGVFSTALDKFKITKLSNTRVQISGGRAWLNHHWIYLSAPFEIDVSESEFTKPAAGMSRTFAVCAYYSDSGRAFSIRYFKASSDVETTYPWYGENAIPSISKDYENDAVYTLGYFVLSRPGSGATIALNVYTSIYSPIGTYTTDDYMFYLIGLNKPTQMIFYATPYASALMDLDESVEHRLSSIETNLSSAYAWALDYWAAKTNYEFAYSWASTFNSNKSKYDNAYSWANTFINNKSNYDDAYRWANTFMSSKSSYDSAYSMARLAYEAAFPSEGGQLPETISRVNTLWSKKSDYDTAYDIAVEDIWSRLYEAAIYAKVGQRGAGLFVSGSFTLSSTSLTTITPALTLNRTADDSYPYILFLGFATVQFEKNETGSWPSTINGRGIRAKAAYDDGHGGTTTVDLGDGESLVYSTNDLAARTNTYQMHFLVPGLLDGALPSPTVKTVYLQIAQSPASATLQQKINFKFWLVPMGFMGRPD